jgi:hypothetical protein
VAGTETIVFIYDTEGRLIRAIYKRDAAADRARSYVFLEDELIGVVAWVKEVGTTSVWSVLSNLVPDPGSPGVVFLLALLGSGALLVIACRYPTAAKAGASAALLIFVAPASTSPLCFAGST